MNSKHIHHISSSLYKKLQQRINKITVHFNTEDIHQFRITYKKLRAFFRLLSQQDKAATTITIAKKLKQLYTLLGTIRDLQLQQQRIKATHQNLKTLTPYSNLLQQQIDTLKPSLLNLVAAKPVAKSKNKTTAKLPARFSTKNFKKFAQQNWLNVTTIITANNFSDDNIHRIRKHLKDLFYNIKADSTLEQQLFSMRIWKGKDAAYINDLLTELGIFQDKCAALALLNSSWLSQLKKSEQEQAKLLKNRWAAEKRGIKKALIAKFKSRFITALP